MALSKKQLKKVTSKSRAINTRANATVMLATQGRATIPQMGTELAKGRAAARATESKSNTSKKGTQTKGSSKFKTIMKRTNQSVVARGGRPVPTYTKKSR